MEINVLFYGTLRLNREFLFRETTWTARIGEAEIPPVSLPAGFRASTAGRSRHGELGWGFTLPFLHTSYRKDLHQARRTKPPNIWSFEPDASEASRDQKEGGRARLHRIALFGTPHQLGETRVPGSAGTGPPARTKLDQTPLSRGSAQ